MHLCARVYFSRRVQPPDNVLRQIKQYLAQNALTSHSTLSPPPRLRLLSFSLRQHRQWEYDMCPRLRLATVRKVYARVRERARDDIVELDANPLGHVHFARAEPS